MNLTCNPRLRILTLCALYLAQGMPFGFVTITLVTFLKHQGAGVEQIGIITAMTSLPWAFKWAWGPVIDRFGYSAMGKRRPWILFAQTMMAATLLAMVLLPDLATHYLLIAGMVFLHNIFVSLQDVSTDALAVDLLDERQRGKANGLMYASSYVGTFIGGSAMSAILFGFGFRAAILTQVGCILAIMLLPILLRERPGEKLLPWTRGQAQLRPEEKTPSSARELLGNLVRVFSLRSPASMGIFSILVRIPVGAMPAIFVVFAVDQPGWTHEAYARINSYAVIAGFLGSVLGGFLADLVGAKRLAVVTSALVGLLWIAFAGLKPLWINPLFITGFLLLDAFVFETLLVSTFAISMGVAWPRIAATQFTVYMSLQNLSSSLGGRLAGWFDRNISVSATYLIFGLFQIALIGLILLIDIHQARRILGENSALEPTRSEPMQAQNGSPEDLLI